MTVAFLVKVASFLLGINLHTHSTLYVLLITVVHIISEATPSGSHHVISSDFWWDVGHNSVTGSPTDSVILQQSCGLDNGHCSLPIAADNEDG